MNHEVHEVHEVHEEYYYKIFVNFVVKILAKRESLASLGGLF
jgi:hypothetical protein